MGTTNKHNHTTSRGVFNQGIEGWNGMYEPVSPTEWQRQLLRQHFAVAMVAMVRRRVAARKRMVVFGVGVLVIVE